MLKSSRAKHNAQPHWNIRLAILLLIEHVEIKGLQRFCNETHFAMKHLCPNKSCIFCFCFLFPQGFCYFWEKDQTTSRKPTKNPTTNNQTAGLAGLFSSSVFSSFFLPLLGEDKKNLLEHIWRSLIDTCISSYQRCWHSEIFAIQFHCKVVLCTFCFGML